MACKTRLAYDDGMLPSNPTLAFGAVTTSAYDTARKRMGSTSELRAAVHLMQQGFDVYRCVSEHAVFDLVAHRDGELYRIEVKTLSKPKAEKYWLAIPWPVNDDWDMFVICAETTIFQFAAGTPKLTARNEVARALNYPIREELQPGTTLVDRIQEVFRDNPDRDLNTAQVLEELVRRGWSRRPGGATSPKNLVAGVMAGLCDRGILDRPERGLYVLSAKEES
jgi:hypothetical protein